MEEVKVREILVNEDNVKSLLHIDTVESSILRALCEDQEIYYQWTPAERLNDVKGRFDLALLNADAHPTEISIVTSIGRLKNTLCNATLVHAESTQNPFHEHFLAMGFKSRKCSNNPPMLIYSYNIATYNHKREWNNSKFWANPENWHKRF